jgi:hypothetical protein
MVAAARKAGKLLAEWAREVLLGAVKADQDVPRVRGVRLGGRGVSAHERAIHVARELDAKVNPEADVVQQEVVKIAEKAAGMAKGVKTCPHGKAKGQHCWQCGGSAKVGEK